MKEEKKDLYRIDPLKVRQKIFDLYPHNSEERKDMVKEERVRELGYLANIKHGFPFDLPTLISMVKENNLKLFFKSSVLIILGFSFLFMAHNFAATLVEIFLLCVGFGVFSFLGIRYIIEIVKNTLSVKRLNTQYKYIDDRISELKRDIYRNESPRKNY